MFLHLNPCWPGSAHDSRVFKESALYDQFEDGKHKGFLLGDSTYALQDYMMTPIMNPNPGPEERFLYFNQSNFLESDFYTRFTTKCFHCLLEAQKLYFVVEFFS